MKFYSEDNLPGRRLKSEARIANYNAMRNPDEMLKRKLFFNVAEKISDYCKIIYSFEGYVDVRLVMTPEEYKEAVTKAFIAGRNARISSLDFVV